MGAEVNIRDTCGRFYGLTDWWFRVRGYGVSMRDTRTYWPLFSERNGYRPRLDVGPYRLLWLTPETALARGSDREPPAR